MVVVCEGFVGGRRLSLRRKDEAGGVWALLVHSAGDAGAARAHQSHRDVIARRTGRREDLELTKTLRRSGGAQRREDGWCRASRVRSEGDAGAAGAAWSTPLSPRARMAEGGTPGSATGKGGAAF